jgi:hypothetical protein
MKTPIKLNKIPIASLINVLQHLYEEGADYIDIQGEHTPGDKNDVIKVTVRPEYYVGESDGDDDSEQDKTDPEYLFTEIEEEPKEDINPISDDEINDLI